MTYADHDQNPSPPSAYRPRKGLYLDWLGRVRCGCGATREPRSTACVRGDRAAFECWECGSIRSFPV